MGSDFEQIIQIEMEAFTEHNPYIYMNFYELNPEGFFVAEENGIIYGFVMGYLSDELEGRIFSLAVRSDIRGKGIGTRLLRRILKEFRRLNLQSAKLEVRESNLKAIDLYKRMGFLECWCEAGYYSDGEDAVVMKKRLLPKHLQKPEVRTVDNFY
nr:ribosomal protein S18-alanine N-acetyltransferase [Methanohalophilus levihalophilus]